MTVDPRRAPRRRSALHVSSPMPACPLSMRPPAARTGWCPSPPIGRRLWDGLQLPRPRFLRRSRRPVSRGGTRCCDAPSGAAGSAPAARRGRARFFAVLVAAGGEVHMARSVRRHHCVRVLRNVRRPIASAPPRPAGDVGDSLMGELHDRRSWRGSALAPPTRRLCYLPPDRRRRGASPMGELP